MPALEKNYGGNRSRTQKSLVVGDTGFLGSHMTLYLLQTQKDKVFGISRRKQGLVNDPKRYQHLSVNLQDRKGVEAFMKAWGPFDIIYYFAADPHVRNADQGMLYSNVLMLDNMLRYVAPGTKFMFCSSATVYGKSLEGEEPCSIKSPCIPISYYGCTKLMAEELAKFYARSMDFHTICVRPVANCGLYSTHGLVHDVFDKLNDPTKHELVLLGKDPGSCKPYAYAPETISIMHYITRLYDKGTYDISPADNLTVREVATLMQHELNTNKPMRFLGENSTWQGDDPVVKIKSEFKMMSSRKSVSRAVQDMIALSKRRNN